MRYAQYKPIPSNANPEAINFSYQNATTQSKRLWWYRKWQEAIWGSDLPIEEKIRLLQVNCERVSRKLRHEWTGKPRRKWVARLVGWKK